MQHTAPNASAAMTQLSSLPQCRAQSLSTLRDAPLLMLIETIQAIRLHLWDKGFLEIPTPVIRAHDCCEVIPRIPLTDGRFLQDSPALALRRHLGHYEKVFTVGQCFRPDPIDDTHLQQFHMLDLYVREASLTDVVTLFRELIGLIFDGPVETLSVAQKIQADFGVDLYNDPESIKALHDKLAALYGKRDELLFPLLDRWISEEVEPLSNDKCLIVSEFPYAAEARAKPKRGAAAIADRVEFQIRGVEIVHLYEDDPEVSAFVARAKEYGHYGPEDDIIRELVESGNVPRYSAGGAIGLERLCAVCLGLPTIQGFVLSPEFLSDLEVPSPRNTA